MSVKDNKRASSSNVQNALLIIALICMAGLCISIVGLIVVVPLCVGLFLSLKNRNSVSLKTSTRAVQILFLVCGIGVSAAALYFSYLSLSAVYKIDQFKEDFTDKEDLAIASKYDSFDRIRNYGSEVAERISYSKMRYDGVIGNLTYDAARNRTTAIEFGAVAAAIFAGLLLLEFGWRRPLAARIDRGELAFPARSRKEAIIGKAGLTGYSIAGELLKWNALKESGTITEDEYKAARKRLLGS